MNDPRRQERIIRLLGATQERLLRYVLVLLPDWNAAQEVVQNVHVVAWRKSADFRSDGEDDFYRWTKQIAFYEVKKYLTQQAASPVALDPELAAMISDEFDDMDLGLEARRHALAGCIEHLAPKDQELLRQRYWSDASVGALANQFGRTVAAVYKSLQRIKQALLLCVDREIARAER